MKKLKQTALLGLLSLPMTPAFAAYTTPEVPVGHYILIDAITGSVIAEKGADEEREIASLTKLMTAYVTFKELENGTMSLDDKVPVSVKAWKAAGSRMFIEEGSEVSVDNLIDGLIAVSGNDAAVALAEHIAGSQERFAELMNAYAKKLGMNETHFVNVTGLPLDEDGIRDIPNTKQFSSARDLSILVKAIITEYPTLYERFSIKTFKYNGIEQKNRNALIHESSNYDGLKTGFTDKAGYCLASSFEKDGRRLISIILGADSPAQRFTAAKTLTNFGFRRFINVQPVDKNTPIHKIDVIYGDKETINVYPSRDFKFTIPRSLTSGNENRHITLKAELDANGELGASLVAPVTENYKVGSLKVFYKNEEVTSIPLVTRDSVGEGSALSKLEDWVSLKYQALTK